jgi:uncharacterized repeat protein (TIGR03803 family)
MRTRTFLLSGLVIGLSMCLCLTAAFASPYAILHNFGGTDDGFFPYFGGPALSGSTLYGMTDGGGGDTSHGTLYRINTDGSGYEILHHFAGDPDGNNPRGCLTLSGSTLYGCTRYGGSMSGGTVFQINTDGNGYQVLKNFSNSGQCFPYGPPVVSGASLYGLLEGSDNGALHGGIYAMDVNGGNYRVLHDFAGKPDGAKPFGSLILVGSTLYGMTSDGGQYGDTGSGYGVIFAIDTDGQNYRILHDFEGYPTDGRDPIGSLTLVGSRLYGMTSSGGSGGNGGVIFAMNLDGGDYRVILRFGYDTSGGAVSPSGSLTLWGGKLYGMTSGGGPGGASGTVFRVNPDGSGYENLHAFVSPDGGDARGDVTFAGSRLFGYTRLGGTYGDGVFFSLQPPLVDIGALQMLLLD